MLDSGTVKTIVDAAHYLVPALGALVAQDAAQRTPEDEALIRQLRVAIGALNMALMEVPRAPPPLVQPPQPATADGSAPQAT
jgi:hypothetical protein